MCTNILRGRRTSANRPKDFPKLERAPSAAQFARCPECGSVRRRSRKCHRKARRRMLRLSQQTHRRSVARQACRRSACRSATQSQNPTKLRLAQVCDCRSGKHRPDNACPTTAPGSADQNPCLQRRTTEISSESKVVPFSLIWNSLQHPEHRIVFPQDRAHRGRSIHAQRLQFAKQQQTRGRGRDRRWPAHACDRGLPHALPRMKFGPASICARRSGDAPAETRASIFTDRNLGLAARLYHERCRRVNGAAVRACTIPLGKRTSGRRTQNLHLHLCEFTAWHGGWR